MPATKRTREPEYRFWCFTLNNYDGVPNEIDFGKHLRYLICQEEISGTGTPHIQGYVEFKRGLTLGQVRKLLNYEAHWEVRKGTAAEAIAYCRKEDSRLAGPYEFGEPSKGQGTRSDIRSAYEAIRSGQDLRQVAEDHTEVFFKYQRGIYATKAIFSPARDPSIEKVVYYFFGPPGVGKSKAAHDLAPLAYRKPPNSKWWDGYDGEVDVIFDDLTPGWFKWADLMQILDRYGTRVEVKGGSEQLRCNRILITSNRPPWDLYRDGEGNHKHPVEALLRRIGHLVEYFSDGTFIDHGCALGYYNGTNAGHFNS